MRHVQFSLSPRDLSMVDETGVRVTAPGAYQVSVGGGQPGTNAPALEAPFVLRESEIWPE